MEIANRPVQWKLHAPGPARHTRRHGRTRDVRPGTMNPALEVRPHTHHRFIASSFQPREISGRGSPRHRSPSRPSFPRWKAHVLLASSLADRSPSRRAAQEDEDAAEKFSLELEMKQLGELQESRNELLSRVSNLKRDLQDWRFKLDNQVKSYRSELGDLRKTLNTEVGSLRKEFQDLRATLKQQLEATAAIAGEGDGN